MILANIKGSTSRGVYYLYLLFITDANGAGMSYDVTVVTIVLVIVVVANSSERQFATLSACVRLNS